MKTAIAFVASVLACVLLSGCDSGKVQAAATNGKKAAASAGAKTAVAESSSSLTEGSPFPKLTLQYASGQTLSIESFRGKMVVLNVWAAWCPPCRREMPSLEALSRKLDARRFAVVGISTDEDAMLAREFLQQNGITFTNFFDGNGKIAKQFDLEVYPETFLIGPDGTLVQRVPGMRDWAAPEMIAFLEMTYETYGGKTAGRTDDRLVISTAHAMPVAAGSAGVQ